MSSKKSLLNSSRQRRLIRPERIGHLSASVFANGIIILSRKRNRRSLAASSITMRSFRGVLIPADFSRIASHTPDSILEDTTTRRRCFPLKVYEPTKVFEQLCCFRQDKQLQRTKEHTQKYEQS